MHVSKYSRVSYRIIISTVGLSSPMTLPQSIFSAELVEACGHSFLFLVYTVIVITRGKQFLMMSRS